MSSHAETFAELSTRRLLAAAFLVQSLVSLVLWFAVDDRPDLRGLSTSDFERWLAASLVGAALLAALGGVVLRRWSASAMVAVGCLLAVTAAFVLYAGYVIVHSA